MSFPRRGGDGRKPAMVLKALMQVSPFLPFLLAVVCLTQLTEYRLRRSFRAQLSTLNVTLVSVQTENRKRTHKLFARQKNNEFLLRGTFDRKHDTLLRDINSMETRNLRTQRFAFQRELHNMKKSGKLGKLLGRNEYNDHKRRQESILRYQHMLNNEVRHMKSKLSVIESRYGETLRKFYRMQTDDEKQLKDALRSEFQRMHSTLLDIEASEFSVLKNATCVSIGTSGRNYKYKHSWIMNRLVEKKIPYLHFSIGGIEYNGRKLPQHYGRIIALMATHKILPNIRTLVYADIDTVLNFEKACHIDKQPLVNKKSAMVISYKSAWNDHRRKVIRTNWFVLRPHLANGVRLLNLWLKNARDVSLQDQTVFNEIYNKPQNEWIRKTTTSVIPVNKRVEIKHCGSYMNDQQRDQCIRKTPNDVIS